MPDWVLVGLSGIIVLVLLTLLLQLLWKSIAQLTQGLESMAQMSENAARGAMECARSLFMYKRESATDAITFSVGSVWLVALGTQILWTDVILASAALAGLTSVPFSGAGIHYDVLLGISAVGSAIIYWAVLGGLLGWEKTNTFATAERGRIFVFFMAVGGLCGSAVTLGALALYRSQMLSEGVDPTALASWITYLPHGILIGISVLLLAASLLAFSVVDVFFITVAGLLCVSAFGLLKVLALTARLLLFVTELVGSLVKTVLDWWNERGVVSETGREIFKSLADRLKDLVGVKPRHQVEVISPTASPTASPVKPSKPATHETIIPAKAHVTDIDLNEDELVGVGVGEASGRGVDHSKNNHRFDFPG